MTQENPNPLDYQGYSTLPKASQFDLAATDSEST